jgi:phage-related protein
MRIMLRQIVFYESVSGDCPIEEFLESLSPKQVQKITWVLRLIEELQAIPSSYLKKLVNTDGIWEVRVVVGNNIFRLLGFFDGPMLIVLNHAFQKKTQKTPSQAINIAESRKKDYFQRKIN